MRTGSLHYLPISRDVREMEDGTLVTLMDNMQRDYMSTMRDTDRSGGVRHKLQKDIRNDMIEVYSIRLVLMWLLFL